MLLSEIQPPKELKDKINLLLSILKEKTPEQLLQTLNLTIPNYVSLISTLEDFITEENQRQFLQLIPLEFLIAKINPYNNLDFILKNFPEKFQSKLLKRLPLEFVKKKLRNAQAIGAILKYLSYEKRMDYLITLTLEFVCSTIELQTELNDIKQLLPEKDQIQLQTAWNTWSDKENRSSNNNIGFFKPADNKQLTTAELILHEDTALSLLAHIRAKALVGKKRRHSDSGIGDPKKLCTDSSKMRQEQIDSNHIAAALEAS